MTSYNLFLPAEYSREMSILTDAEFGRLIRFLYGYAFDGIDDTSVLTGNEKFFAGRVMASEDRNRANYERRVAACREHGKMGGRPAGRH